MSTRANAQTRTTAAPAPSISSVVLQRQCACGGKAGVDGECDACRSKRRTMQRAPAVSPTAATNAIPSSVNGVVQSAGRSLDNGTRTFMESRFGHDFSRVRVHDDASAARSANAVRARAYT
ncbi:MAG: DUF4157 domain-containing protein, partial [Chloroflexi bacterium]|nr:DUF4157 domain-containing protein [Chloroflexota bacterium]